MRSNSLLRVVVGALFFLLFGSLKMLFSSLKIDVNKTSSHQKSQIWCGNANVRPETVAPQGFQDFKIDLSNNIEPGRFIFL